MHNRCVASWQICPIHNMHPYGCTQPACIYRPAYYTLYCTVYAGLSLPCCTHAPTPYRCMSIGRSSINHILSLSLSKASLAPRCLAEASIYNPSLTVNLVSTRIFPLTCSPLNMCTKQAFLLHMYVRIIAVRPF